MRKIKIAGAALNQTPINWDLNLRNIKSAIGKAKDEQVDILCLPELCLTGYGCEDLFLSNWLCESALEKLSQVIQWTNNIFVTVGMPLKWKGDVYNGVCLIHNKNILGFYLKQHLAIDGVYYESRWFKPWNPEHEGTIKLDGKEYSLNLSYLNVKGINIGFEICEDAWVNERPANRLGEIDLILNPSASHFAFGKSLERQQLVVDSSDKYNCCYLYANLLGNESGQIIFDGEVLIARNGALLAKNKTFQFEDVTMVSTEINFDSKVETTIPVEVADTNTLFIEAVSLGLFDYLRKSHSKGFVISLSGGADSGCCAIIVAESIKRAIAALGLEVFLKKIGLALQSNENVISQLVTCAYQSSENSSKATFESAEAIARSIGADFYHWSIDDQVKSTIKIIEEKIGGTLNWDEHDISLQNIQARTRSPIIWVLANLKKALLIVTSNRSESAVGYATMDGDTSGSLAPIAGVSKSFIQGWLKWAENELGYSALSKVNQLEPTAELRPESEHQTDEKDLMPYNLLAQFEELAINKGMSPEQVFFSLKEDFKGKESTLVEYISKFYSLWSRNQWKRERSAPSFNLDIFNISPRSWYRFPILSSGFKDELKNLNRLI